MIITRQWAMPNSRTFSIKPINELIMKYIRCLPPNPVIIDPYANNNRMGTITNDIDPDCDADYHMEATEFLHDMLNSRGGVADLVLYDPPYSPRQLSECYKKFGRSVTMTDTQSSYWSRQKKMVAQLVKPGGYTICFGWNSNGIGKTNGFEIVEILLVAHGTTHNDTICTVEKKVA